LGFRFRDSSLQIRREPFVRFSLFQEPRPQRCCRRDGEQGPQAGCFSLVIVA
jgi:hypothetical protein